MTRELHRPRPRPARRARRVGRAPAAATPGAVYRDVDAVGVTNYTGWYEEPLAPARRGRALDAPRARVAAPQLPRQGPDRQRVRRRGATRATPRRARRAGFQAALLARAPRRLRARRRGSTGALIWALRDFAVAPSFAGGSIRRLVPGHPARRAASTRRGCSPTAGRAEAGRARRRARGAAAARGRGARASRAPRAARRATTSSPRRRDRA